MKERIYSNVNFSVIAHLIKGGSINMLDQSMKERNHSNVNSVIAAHLKKSHQSDVNYRIDFNTAHS